MRAHLTARRYCAAVSLLALVAIAALARTIQFDYVAAHPLTVALLSAGLVLGELLPVTVTRRGGNEELSLSTSFALALLLVAGLGTAVIAQGIASAIEDRVSGKPWWRVCFNVGQYTLSLTAALLVTRSLLGQPIGSAAPFTGGALPAVLVGMLVFYIVNAGTVGTAVALYQGTPIGPYFRADAPTVVINGMVLLFLAPIVIAAAAFSSALLPLFAAPMVAMYHAGRQAARSDHAAYHDALTGLPNRAAFQAAVERAVSDERAFCVLLMDLDRFKDVNDTLGHGYGDLLLKRVAQRLDEQLGVHLLARLGGDEFAVLGLDCDRDASAHLAQLAAGCLRTPFELDQVVVDTQASVGIALSPGHGRDVESLLQRADVAMYRAKETHDSVVCYEEDHDDHSTAKLAQTADLRAAIESDAIVVFYQPELDLRSGAVGAVEALVRWQHPELGLLAPGAFLETAERANLIKPLTQRVLELSLAQVAQWRTVGLDVTVAVNVSTRVLVDREFTGRVLAALEHADVAPTRLKLEITESVLMADPVSARSVLEELAGVGIEISIDDFGTGFSSLAYLARLPVSEVKIDRSFVSRMAEEPSDAIIVSSTIDLAHNLGLRAVAEGIEDLGLLAELRALGCDVAQGYGISRPIPGADATRWLLDAQRALPADWSGQRAA
ncbi:MAG: EAL domain-containing protein [Solirubrobacteraceae bacterium]|jgi:diguanylate cyclase (GGDEF)-like protein